MKVINNTRFWFFGAVIFTMTSLIAQENKVHRSVQLDTDWSFKKDNASSGPEKATFDVSDWRKVNLPHDWSIEDLPNQIADSIIGPFSKAAIGKTNTGFTLGGTAWYRKTFKINKYQQGKTIYVQFDGVYTNSDVWVNGHHLGNHAHGYTPFYYDLTPFLLPAGKDNIIAVRVNNEGETARWYSGSGIYRHVWLTVVNPVHVDVWGVYITTPKVSKISSNVQVVTIIKNTGKENTTFTLKTDIIEATGKIVSTIKSSAKVDVGDKTETKQTVSIPNTRLWSPQTPNLYKAKVTVLVNNKETDVVSTAFGVREIKIDAKNGLLINGLSTKLKGGCIHNDNGPLGSAAFDRAEERKVEILKANGFNAIRSSHNPPSQVFLDACDRLGMLVMDEAFDMWTKPKTKDDYHRYFKDSWNKDLTTMILRDRNHPSVILWSIGNEIKERVDSIGLVITKKLKERVRELDPTRMVTEAICFTPSWEKKTAPVFEILDVAGYNYLPSKYEKDHQSFPERIMVSTESFPKDIFENWEFIKKNNHIIGDFVWTAMDYLGEAGIGGSALFPKEDDRLIPQWPNFNAFCGDIDLVGDKKPQSYYRDIVWGSRSIEMMTSKAIPKGLYEFYSWWGWPGVMRSWNWSGEEGKLMRVLVYSRCKSVKLELNGKLIGEQKIPENSITATFEVPYAAGKLVAKGYDNGKEIGSVMLKTTGAPAAIRLKADRNKIKANPGALSHINVEIVDANGNLVPNVESLVNYTITGVGTLAAIGSGNPDDMSSFQQPKKKVYQGKGLAIIRSNGSAGKITIKAKAKGLKDAIIEITAL
jgi:beta-galactosidase